MSMLICGKRSKHRHESLSVSLNGEAIECVAGMKYLGLQIDKHLSFESHINMVCGKLSARPGLLWRIGSFIPQTLAKSLYLSLIYPHLLYRNFALDGASQTLKQRLQVQQNKAMRAVLKHDYLYPSAQLYIEARVDKVSVTIKKSLCNIVYQGVNKVGAEVYNSMFNLETSARDLRSNDQMLVSVPKCRTKFGENNMA